MKAVDFDEQNVVISEAQDEYMNLPALAADDEHGSVVSCWELSEEDLKKVQETRKVWLSCYTFGALLQPVLLSVKKGDVIVSRSSGKEQGA